MAIIAGISQIKRTLDWNYAWIFHTAVPFICSIRGKHRLGPDLKMQAVAARGVAHTRRALAVLRAEEKDGLCAHFARRRIEDSGFLPRKLAGPQQWLLSEPGGRDGHDLRRRSRTKQSREKPKDAVHHRSCLSS
jgi:hypothetical protein